MCPNLLKKLTNRIVLTIKEYFSKKKKDKNVFGRVKTGENWLYKSCLYYNIKHAFENDIMYYLGKRIDSNYVCDV